MPMYEYRCNDCEHTFEARQKFSDAPLSECPRCEGSVSKLISRTAFTLKGGGWYDQGYGNNSKPSTCAAADTSGGCSGCPKAANE